MDRGCSDVLIVLTSLPFFMLTGLTNGLTKLTSVPFLKLTGLTGLTKSGLTELTSNFPSKADQADQANL